MKKRADISHYAAGILAAVALIYALLAGLHTVQDFDLGWQLATGRWVVQHRHIFSADVFSYTANGAPWIYPVLSGIIFYFAYLAGGYAALSWMGAAACAATIAILILARRDSIANSALALIAVPLIANRTQPRAEMFTTILFAAFLTLLWRHYRSGDRPHRSLLWLLPILMLLWTNLHPGFAAGLALCAAYLLLEVFDFGFPEKRLAVRIRLRRAWVWLALTAVATFLNPWAANIYRALLRQQEAQNLHNQWVVEWEGVHPSWNSLRQAIDFRDPQSAFWWLLAIALLCLAIALWRKRWGSAVVLLISVYLALEHVRLQALFACIAAVMGGSLLTEAWSGRNVFLPAMSGKKKKSENSPRADRPRWAFAALCLISTALTLVTALRCWDLVTTRYYLRSSQLSLFGTGLSWWFPERALDFIGREKLPANIFNGYSLGGYLTWCLFPKYLDYIDSRALPFGPQLFFRAYDLSVEAPQSPVWQQEADARNINTLIVSLARYDGIALFPQLRAFCRNDLWRPVYLDEVSAVFLRRTPQTAAIVDRLQIDCDKVTLALPSELQSSAASNSHSAELFNFYANSAELLYTLGRYPEALASLDRAQSIFTDNANLHWIRGLLLEHAGNAAGAESEFLASLRLEPKDENWIVLGLFYMSQKRYDEAIEIFRRSAESSSRPHDLWMLLGQAYLQTRQPRPALEAFDKAEATSPFRDEAGSLGAHFNSMVATGRAKASYQLGDLPRAVTFQEEAVRLAPTDAKLWQGLADLYDAQGKTAQAAQARSHNLAP